MKRRNLMVGNGKESIWEVILKSIKGRYSLRGGHGSEAKKVER